jgi:hypothetical protein
MEEGLVKLGQAMGDKEPPLDSESQPDLPTAGYTYLGQFIDHDLTLDLTPLESATPDVERMVNARTPVLDLDNVYGGGPNVSPFLYAKGHLGAERFLIGKTRDDPTLAEDLPRNTEGTALTGDPRQDENLILAQLHVAFLKLHNAIVADPALLNSFPGYRRSGDTDFAVARRIVIWHYQWIVRHDYLPRIIDPITAEKLPDLAQATHDNPPQISNLPIEFSVGAFRFGHSMVRDVYQTGVNGRHNRIRLLDLLVQTGSMGGASPALPAEWVVDWKHFFTLRGQSVGHLNRARKIDTQIANTLFQLPSTPPELPVRTLLRGGRVGLPYGEEIAKEINKNAAWVKVLTEEEIVGGAHRDILTNPQYGLRGNTPLWYYVLKEAELYRAPSGFGGRSLGPAGSYLVAKVILDVLSADTDSYLSAPGWTPTLPTMLGADRDSFSSLLKFAATGRSST